MRNDCATDRHLLDGWMRGEEQAATELIRRHAGAVARFLGGAGAHSDDVEDLVQETFFRAFRRAETYNGRAEFRTWLIAIGSNALRDAWRKRKNRPVVPLGDRDFVDESADPVSESHARDIESRVAQCVRRLPPMQRDVFLLRAQQDASYDEIAAALNTSSGAARVHYHHAVRRLKKALSVELEA